MTTRNVANVATHWYEARLIVRYTATEDTYQDVPYNIVHAFDCLGDTTVTVKNISKEQAPTRDHGDV